MDSSSTPAPAPPRASGVARRIPSVIAPGALAVALLLAYIPVLVELVADWLRDANYHHGFLIPLVAAYLAWRERDALRRAPRSPAMLGIVGLLLAGALLILGSAGAEVFTQRVSLVVLLASLTWYLMGREHLRRLAFPIGFLLLAIPLPYVIYYALTTPMQTLAARAAVVGLKVIGVPVLLRGNIIHLPQISLEVAEACSGIRSLYAFLAVGALVAHATPIPLPARLLVFFSAIPLSVAGNALRVWGSGLGAYLVGPQATRGAIHELFGIIVFVVSLALFFGFRHMARKQWSSATSRPSLSSPPPGSIPPSFAPGDRPPPAPPTSGSSPKS